MKKKIKYEPFDKFVLRTPILSLDVFKELTSQQIISNEKIISLCKDKTIIEAIYLASPTLYFQIEKLINNEIDDVNKVEKLKHTVLKYVSRMSSRCTPYGLFAGCSVGNLSKETNIILNHISEHKRYTRLDMNYVVAFSYGLLKDKKIRKKLKFYPNSSIYSRANAS